MKCLKGQKQKCTFAHYWSFTTQFVAAARSSKIWLPVRALGKGASLHVLMMAPELIAQKFGLQSNTSWLQLQKSLNVIKCYLTWCTILIVQLLFSYLNSVLNSFHKSGSTSLRGDPNPPAFEQKKKYFREQKCKLQIISFLYEVKLIYIIICNTYF